MNVFSKWRAVKVNGEKQGYLQKVMEKSKTQDSETDGEVIVLLNR